MSDAPPDVNPERRAEYQAALAVLSPQIAGLRSVANDPDLSSDARAVIQQELDDRVRRSGLLVAALQHLDDCNYAQLLLLRDGYPELPRGVVSNEILKELVRKRDAIDAALEQFTTATVTVSLGSPADKPAP